MFPHAWYFVAPGLVNLGTSRCGNARGQDCRSRLELSSNRQDAFPFLQSWDFTDDLAERWTTGVYIVAELTVMFWSALGRHLLLLRDVLRLFS